MSDEIVAAQWRAQRADQEAEQAREARRRVTWGGGLGPLPQEILTFRPSEIVSGAIL